MMESARNPQMARSATPGSAEKRKKDPRISDLIHMIRARYGAILILSHEEDRVLDLLATWSRVTRVHIGRIMRWSRTEGLVEHKPNVARDTATTDPINALDRVLGVDSKGEYSEFNSEAGILYVFRDLHHFMQDPDVLRRLRDCAHKLRGTDNTLILLSPRMAVPSDLEKDLAVVDFPLPTADEIASLVDNNYADFTSNPGEFVDCFDANLRSDIIRACMGLTEIEANDALAKAIIECGGLTPDVPLAINRTKREAIRKTNCLEAHDADEGMDSVGGLDVLKAWIERRARCFSDEARAFGIEWPKGVLTLGVPGGGKGLSARAVANRLRLPLLRLDLGAVFGGVVGESEGNLRAALKIAEAISPCVLWVDEIEKGLAGVGSSDRSDGGTAARVFGTFLTWLQEKKSPVFVYGTANDISVLPPELLRKGRFDELFFIDLPNTAERREILAIHLRKRGRDPALFNLDELAACCEGYVGAEIEQVIKEALIDAFYEGSELGNRHIMRVFERTVPLVKTQKKKIQKLLAFVEEGRAVRASSGEQVQLPEDFWSERDEDFWSGIIEGRVP